MNGWCDSGNVVILMDKFVIGASAITGGFRVDVSPTFINTDDPSIHVKLQRSQRQCCIVHAFYIILNWVPIHPHEKLTAEVAKQERLGER